MAELTSGTGALVLGVVPGIAVVELARPMLIPILVAGRVVHGWGMFDVRGQQTSNGGSEPRWATPCIGSAGFYSRCCSPPPASGSRDDEQLTVGEVAETPKREMASPNLLHDTNAGSNAGGEVVDDRLRNRFFECSR